MITQHVALIVHSDHYASELVNAFNASPTLREVEAMSENNGVVRVEYTGTPDSLIMEVTRLVESAEIYILAN